MKEKWKQIPGSAYEISNQGRVRKHIWSRTPKSPEFMAIHRTERGSLAVTLPIDGYTGTRYIARLVGEAFMPDEFKKGLRAFYKDGNKDNCRPNNLAWVSPSVVSRGPYSKNKKVKQ